MEARDESAFSARGEARRGASLSIGLSAAIVTATIDEPLRDKPSVHALMKLGQISYIGPLSSRQAAQDYVNFYAFLHGVVDEKIGRLLRALGDAHDPRSLRSRTVIARISDHGEMGLSHGGLRQKMFNAYEETIRVPFVLSNPLLFRGGAECATPVTLVDLVPTLLELAGAPAEGTLDGHSLCSEVARRAGADRAALGASQVDFSGALDAAPSRRTGEHALFTYDDHQAATAQQEAPGQPNRIRCVLDKRFKYAVYVDPHGRAAPEFELYDLKNDRDEARNLLDKSTGGARTPGAARARERLHEVLVAECARTGTALPGLRPPGS